ncbi:MAG: LamG domain-containing protein [Steroidobacteraceae bacterium]
MTPIVTPIMTLRNGLDARLAGSSLARAARLAGLLAFAGLLAACGGGASVQQNAQTSGAAVATYTGPAPANADVQSFEVNLWQNVKAANRCGGCHTQGGQSPQFARTDDVNLAYQAANSVVDLQQPNQSMMVQKVGGGHNCWLASAQACGDTLTSWITAWAGATAQGAQQVKLVAPPEQTVGASKSFPADPGLYQSTVYPVVQAWCSRCHSDTASSPQQPYFASNDISIAYAAAQPKIVLADAGDPSANPSVPACTIVGAGASPPSGSELACLSRFINRLAQDHHNCWSDCATDAQQMLAKIEAMANAIALAPIDPSLVVSKAVSLYQGTVASGQGRYSDAQIALYEFKTETGNIAYDTSGVEPELDLTISGNANLLPNTWGLYVGTGGKAQGTTTASAKLANLIESTGEFSIEAWATPANQAQLTANLVSYSGGPTASNFALQQNAFQYEALTRSSVTDTNGMPPLATSATNQLAQAALQHIVVTYDPVNGRKLYVNGQFTGNLDSKGGGTLANWDNTFALVLGDDPSGDAKGQWTGTISMLAIHNRALTPAEIQQNFNAGVGEKYYLLFDVSSLTSVPQSYIMMTASVNDSYSYLFTNPTFISLDPSQTPDDIPISGIRIGINGAEAPVGQTYIPLATTVTSSGYSNQMGEVLSKVGAVIPLENGPASDQFFLSFAKIAAHTHTYTDPAVSAPAPTAGPAVADLGVRTFERINQSMAKLTGISPLNASVASTYASVQQSLPSIPDFSAYSYSNQMAVAQLAAAYCGAAAASGSSIFGAGFNAAQSGSALAGNSSTLITALYDNLIGTAPDGTQLTIAPSPAEVQSELGTLINTLASGSAGSASGGAGTIATAACSALLASASTIIN